MATYVLVHGGGHGGWCYQRVARLLEAEGHFVHRPTFTGLGDRVHLVSADVDLETHITDVVNVLTYEDLDDVVLVGHSYGGMVIKGVADRASDRVGQLVYLDAPSIENGQRVVDASPELAQLREGSQIIDGVELFGFPSEELVQAYGVTDPADVTWMVERLTAHPWKVVDQPLVIHNEEAVAAIPAYQIVATRFAGAHRDPDVMARARADGRVWEIDGGHDLMITHPDLVAKALTEIAADRSISAIDRDDDPPTAITADDKFAIEEFIAGHYAAVDSADVDAFVASFAEEGVFVIRDENREVAREITGHAALEELGTRFTDPARVPSRHFASNFVIASADEGARGTCSVMRFATTTGPIVLDTGMVRFSVRKVDGQWRWARYDLSLDPSFFLK
jgi:pimeloyl-ACP methyl ester carboxylesterase